MMKLAERIFKRNDYYITSPFGERIHPISQKKSFHYGCDYGTNCQNWEQYALEEGQVIDVRIGCKDGDGNGYGNYVKIKYPRIRIQILHAHLKEVKVKKGQQVNHDTIVGLTGTTGNSTGIHLHLGLQNINSTNWINPENYNYKEGEIMPFKIGDYLYAKDEIKLYTTIEYIENKYTMKKGEKVYVRYITNNNVALANPETHEYYESAWTNELDKLTTTEPQSDYKELYEKELLINKNLQAQNQTLQNKINKALEDLK